MPYHPRRTERALTERAEMYAIIERGKYASLALCRGAEPYIVTLSYGFDTGQQTFYFHCARQGQKIDFLKANDRVCLTIVEIPAEIGDSCAHPYRSVVVRGRLQFVTEEQERLAAITCLLDHFSASREKMLAKIDKRAESWLNTQLLKLQIEEITGKAKPAQA